MTALSPALRRTLGLSALLSLVWLFAAALRPEATYHLAPLLITLGAPVLAGALDPGRRVWIVSVGAAVAVGLGATSILAAAGWLRGPSLLPFGGPAVESLVFIVLASLGAVAVGAIVAGRREAVRRP